MEASLVIKAMLSSLVVGLLMIGGWKILDWVWLKPKRLEKCLRQQGLTGNPYRFLSGDIKENFAMSKQARAKPMALSDDIAQYVAPFLHQTVRNYGLSKIMVHIDQLYYIIFFLFFSLMPVISWGKMQAKIHFCGMVRDQE